MALSVCQKAVDQAAPESQATAPAVEPAQAPWPASLPVFGDGVPNPGDPCHMVGESLETVNYLDDSASLLICLSADDVAKLGGKAVATIDSVTLVSVPTAAAVPRLAPMLT
jgi:hypothetical protein